MNSWVIDSFLAKQIFFKDLSVVTWGLKMVPATFENPSIQVDVGPNVNFLINNRVILMLF